MLSPDPVGSRIQGAQPRLDPFALETAPDLRRRVLSIGREQHSLLVLDEVLHEPRVLVELAVSRMSTWGRA